MAWTTPKTDWMDDDLFTYADMNRISANVNYLYPDASLKTNWVRNDFLDEDSWAALLAALRYLVNTIQIDSDIITSTTLNSATMNAVEQQLQDLYDKAGINALQHEADIYVGDKIYVANAGQYPGVAENYVRGV